MKNRLFSFNNSYSKLPERFYERIQPVPVKSPEVIILNTVLLRYLDVNLHDLEKCKIADFFSGNKMPEGADPVALAYAGHQYGHFVPQLGDGRAVLLGEIIDGDGKRRDLQLKGSGRTSFSRQGDGRYALGPAIREYIISEAMHALGIPTARSLALVKTGELIIREKIVPGAVLTRIASSHIRVGTFEFFAARHDIEALRLLADYVIARHYPHSWETPHPYYALLEAVVNAQACLTAQWMSVGFIHGVMNTDNTLISGETIDYGPCAFMDSYDPNTKFSSIDRYGRYAYGNQNHVAQWNMECLATCLLPLLNENQEKAAPIAKEITGRFPVLFKGYWLSFMKAKISLKRFCPDDASLVEDLLALMKKHHADFTLTFYYLKDVIQNANDSLQTFFSNSTEWNQWLSSWRRRLSREERSFPDIARDMQAVNPAFIPRNHLIEQVITAAVEQNDFSKMKHLISVLSRPYENQPDSAKYMLPPRPEERIHQTFCGT